MQASKTGSLTLRNKRVRNLGVRGPIAKTVLSEGGSGTSLEGGRQKPHHIYAGESGVPNLTVNRTELGGVSVGHYHQVILRRAGRPCHSSQALP